MIGLKWLYVDERYRRLPEICRILTRILLLIYAEGYHGFRIKEHHDLLAQMNIVISNSIVSADMYADLFLGIIYGENSVSDVTDAVTYITDKPE